MNVVESLHSSDFWILLGSLVILFIVSCMTSVLFSKWKHDKDLTQGKHPVYKPYNKGER